METRRFGREYVMEEVLFDKPKIRVDEPMKQHRWFTEYLLIFEDDDCLWQTIYHKPHGDSDLPFEYEDTIECLQVWERPVQSVEYVTEDPEDAGQLEQ